MEKKKNKSNISLYFLFGLYFFIALAVSGSLLFVILSYRHSNRIICTIVPKKPVLGQTTKPALADLVVNEGGLINIDPINIIVQDNTFPFDIYLYSKEIKKTNPVMIEEMWQISDIYEVYFKSFFNDAVVVTPGREFIIGIRYNEQDLVTELNLRLPENTLKIIYKEDQQDQWQLIDNAVVDIENNIVSTIANKGGFYSVVGGWWITPTPTSYPWLTLFAKANRLYPTKIPWPTTSPTIIPEPTKYQLMVVTVIPTQFQSQVAASSVHSQDSIRCFTENEIRKDILDLILDDISKAFGVDI